MKKILQDGDSEIYIEHVVRQDDRLCISLLINSNFRYREGNFLSAHVINPDRSFTTTNGKWSIIFPDGKVIDNTFGSGSGPGERLSIFIDLESAKKMNSSNQIKYGGIIKYGYKRI